MSAARGSRQRVLPAIRSKEEEPLLIEDIDPPKLPSEPEKET